MRRLVQSMMVGAALLCGAGSVFAQEGPASWLARVFDPATLNLTVFPGSQLNRKLSTDSIGLERGGNKRIAIYLIGLDQLEAASGHFQKQFGVAPEVTGQGSRYLAYTFDFTEGRKGPEKLKGLLVRVTRSPFVDGRGQITMEYLPPTSS